MSDRKCRHGDGCSGDNGCLGDNYMYSCIFYSICTCTLLLYSSLKRVPNSVLRDVHIMETVA